jgi:hypothetical protein
LQHFTIHPFWFSRFNAMLLSTFVFRLWVRHCPRKLFALNFLSLWDDLMRAEAAHRLPKSSTPVKALRFAPMNAPAPPSPTSCAALTRCALWEVSPHRRGRGRGAAADGRQARQTARAAHGRQERRTWGPLQRLQQSGPPCLPFTTHPVSSWRAEHVS